MIPVPNPCTLDCDHPWRLKAKGKSGKWDIVNIQRHNKRSVSDVSILYTYALVTCCDWLVMIRMFTWKRIKGMKATTPCKLAYPEKTSLSFTHSLKSNRAVPSWQKHQTQRDIMARHPWNHAKVVEFWLIKLLKSSNFPHILEFLTSQPEYNWF